MQALGCKEVRASDIFFAHRSASAVRRVGENWDYGPLQSPEGDGFKLPVPGSLRKSKRRLFKPYDWFNHV